MAHLFCDISLYKNFGKPMIWLFKFDVWILLKKWILVDKKRRMAHLRKLFQAIRTNFLSQEEVSEEKIIA
ncbi:unnamed protein product [Dracunculus medinensis]|uniref:Uncharacterized protein n=1 Tax=Dracunculus medinensis TaxID=318479 RepID=A0A0N4UBH5_DRAME|nr:unnamed protein product [Dracunculus medinensis]